MIPAFLEFACSEKLYMFFDETNNVRKLLINSTKPNGLNNDDFPFVLGGLATTYKPDIPRTLKRFNNFFKNNKIKIDGDELKFSEFSQKGNGNSIENFKKILKSKKINLLLKFIIKNNMYLHYSVFDIRYFVFVDLLESDALIEEINIFSNKIPNTLIKESLISNYHFELKNILDDIIKFSQIDFLTELSNLNFPNINLCDIEELRATTLKYINIFESKNPTKVKYLDVIKRIVSKNNFFLILELDEANLIQNGLSHVYSSRIDHFPNSIITFDNEYEIQAALASLTYAKIKNKDNDKLDSPRVLKKLNFSFEDSKDNIIIQMADILIGFIRELYKFSYNFDKELEEWKIFIHDIKESLNESELDCIKNLCNLHTMSLVKYNGMQFTCTPIKPRERFDIMINIFSS